MSGGGLMDSQFSDAIVGSTASPGLGFTLFGETVTYWTVNGPGVAPSSAAITATRSPTPDAAELDENEQTKWVISATDVANPALDDYLIDDDSQRWDVIRATPQEGGLFELTCIHAQEA